MYSVSKKKCFTREAHNSNESFAFQFVSFMDLKKEIISLKYSYVTYRAVFKAGHGSTNNMLTIPYLFNRNKIILIKR